ncbi:hypothetical protein ABGB17_37730 [Sphaerisporangium sp. B11E5]
MGKIAVLTNDLQAGVVRETPERTAAMADVVAALDATGEFPREAVKILP